MTAQEQEQLSQRIRDTWTKFSLGEEGTDISPEVVDYIKWLYELDNLQVPPVFVAGSPYGAQIMANYLSAPRDTEKLAKSDPFIASVIDDLKAQLENHGIKPSPVKGITSRVDSAAFLDSVRKHDNFKTENSGLTYYDFNYTGIGYDSSWVGWYEYQCAIKAKDANPNDQDYLKVRGMLKTGVWDSIFFLEAAVICKRPLEVHFDANQRLHNLRGPAVSWPDGYNNFFIHSMSVNSDWILKPETLSVAVILEESNVEFRRAMIEIVGMERFIKESGAKVVDSWVDGGKMSGSLLRIELENDEPIQVYIYNDPSTNKSGPLRVPPDIRKAKDAVAWTYGIEPENYNPLVEA